MIENDDDTQLSRIESAFVTSLALAASSRAGTLVRDAGYAPPTEEQGREMTRVIVEALTALAIGLREPGGQPNAEELTGIVGASPRAPSRA